MDIYKIIDKEYSDINNDAQRFINKMSEQFPDIVKQAAQLLSNLGLNGFWKLREIALAEIIKTLLSIRQDVDNALTDKLHRRNMQIEDLRKEVKELQQYKNFIVSNNNRSVEFTIYGNK